MLKISILNSKNIKIAAIGSLSIKFLSAFFAFLNSVLLARILGIEGFGIYILAFTTVTLLSIPVALGLPLLITRYIPKYEVEGNQQAIKGLLIRSNQTVLITTLIIYMFAIISYFLWWKTLDSKLVETLWYGFLLVPLLALGSLRAAALRGLRYIILGQLPDTLLRNFLLCVGIASYFLLEIKLSPARAMLIHVVAAAIAFLMGYVFLRIKLLNKIKHIKPIFHNKEWFVQTIPFSINSGVQIVKSKLLTYVLAVFGSVKAVAIFEVAMRGATLVAFTLDALNVGMAPYISNAFEKKDFVSLQRIAKKASKMILIFALPTMIIFILFGKSLLVFLYNDEYSISYEPLIILCIGQLIYATAGTAGLVLIMTGNQKYFTKISLITALLNLILSIPFVIYFDVLGAAIIFSILLILQNVVLVIYVKNKLKINTTFF